MREGDQGGGVGRRLPGVCRGGRLHRRALRSVPTGRRPADRVVAPHGSPVLAVAASAEPVAWVGSFRSVTYHELYVGGRCTTRWRGRLRFTVDDAGRDRRLRSRASVRQAGVRLPHRADPDATHRASRSRAASVARPDRPDAVPDVRRPGQRPDFGGFGAFLPVKVALPLHGGCRGRARDVGVARRRAGTRRLLLVDRVPARRRVGLSPPPDGVVVTTGRDPTRA